MKPSPQIVDDTSGSLQNFIYESDKADCCNLNIYEFQEGEDVYGSRSLGYQKPKHMWMAKDQAFTNSKPTSPNASINYVDFDTDIGDSRNLVPQNCVNQCSFPVNLNYSMESPCPPNSVQGLSVTLSSYTNTSSSLSSHTPPSIGICTNELVSSSTSPSSSELHSIKSDCTALTSKSSLKTKILLTIKSKSKGKNFVSSVSPLESKSSSCSEDGPSVQRNKNRQFRSNRKNKRSLKTDKLTIKLPNLESNAFTNDKVFVKHPDKTESCLGALSNESKSSSSPPLTGGLKIRLRRDPGLIDSGVCRNKKLKNKNSTVFRIVESSCDADAPGGDYSRRIRAITGHSTLSPTFNLASGGLRVGDIVWAKLAGYPYWPSQISAIWARTAHQLSQATLLPSQLLDTNTGSLSVLATPDDPSLASGYNAKVEWLAWDQCSYLSCAKLFPFKEAFDKLYNPRTRVKGYTEAVRLAKQYVNGNYPLNCDSSDLQTANLSSPNKSHSSLLGHFSAPPSTDSQWSAVTTLSSSLEPYAPGLNSTISRENLESNCQSNQINSSFDNYPQSSIFSHSNDLITSQNMNEPLENPFYVSNGLCNELPDLGNMPLWAPLPQLDVSGLGVFHVPSFSEDEEDFDQPLVNPLEFDFGSCI